MNWKPSFAVCAWALLLGAGQLFGAPVITGFSPAAGRPGTNVIITGTNFLGASAVRFNGLDAASFNVLSNLAIQAVVPVGASTGLIRIIAPAGSGFSSSNFVVQPTILGFSPAFGAVGTNVTITGANFNVGTPVVKFNGVQAAVPTGVTFGQLSAVVPASFTTGPITVTTPAGTASSAANFYGAPVLNSFNPTHGLPGTNVTLSGQNFIGTSAVRFNGLEATSFNVLSNLAIQAVVPAGASTGLIQIIAPAGSVFSSSNFVVQPLPILSVSFVPPNQVRLTWASTLSNYFLEYKSPITAGVWFPVPTPPVIVGNESQVTETNNSSPRFYQLHRQP